MKISRPAINKNILWALVGLFVFLSIVPVLSITPYIIYSPSKNSFDFMPLVKHVTILLGGLFIFYICGLIKCEYYRKISVFLWIVSLGLVGYAAMSGTVIGGKDASRWIDVGGLFKFQPSMLLIVTTGMYLAFHFDKYSEYEKKVNVIDTALKLWLPVVLSFLMIAYHNLSTALILLLVVGAICFLAKYPLKYWFSGILVGLVSLVIAYFVFSKFENNRISTWISRVESFADGSAYKKENLQVRAAKMAVASGGFTGKGAGKGSVKSILAESDSDFMFASMVEELGVVMGGVIIILYLILFINIISISFGLSDVFAKLLVISAGLPIIIQAFINIGVSLSVMPVTGQSLPFFNTSGSSIIVTFFSMGMIMSAYKETKRVK